MWEPGYGHPFGIQQQGPGPMTNRIQSCRDTVWRESNRNYVIKVCSEVQGKNLIKDVMLWHRL